MTQKENEFDNTSNQVRQAAAKWCCANPRESHGRFEAFINGAEWWNQEWHDLIADPTDLPISPKYNLDWVLGVFQDRRDGFIGLPHICEYVKDKQIWRTTESDEWESVEAVIGDCIAWRILPYFDEEKFINRFKKSMER